MLCVFSGLEKIELQCWEKCLNSCLFLGSTWELLYILRITDAYFGALKVRIKQEQYTGA